MIRNIIFWSIIISSFASSLASIFLASELTWLDMDYNSTSLASFNSRRMSYHNSGFFDLKDAIRNNLNKPFEEDSAKYNGYWTQAGITSHHLPTAMSFIGEFYKILSSSDGPRNTFIIAGPDHFEKCRGNVSTANSGYITPFGRLEIDNNVKDDLLGSGVVFDDECFNGEHSIGVQAVFIKHLFPDAKIVPVLFSAEASGADVEKFVDSITPHKDKITLISSVDFSHYESYEAAKSIDSESEGMIRNLNADNLSLRHADSPPSIKAVVLFSKKIGSEKPFILGRANSYDFTSAYENTTGYINAVFVDFGKTRDLITLMFVGDMMLTRNVGKKTEEAGDWRWPFQKIGEYLRSADLTFGNLETTISDRGRNVGSIYSFRSNPRVVEGLTFAGFDVLSVANNHMGDWTRQAFEDTFSILRDNGIDYVGGGFNEEEAHSLKMREIKGTKFGFLGYTDLGARYTEAKGEVSGIAWSSREVVERDVKNAADKSDFLVVSFHFGDEYKTFSNARQKILARVAIDSGADLVIGHHPHVIQETEAYKDGFIAYSLGNFIFDQNFSKETMEGLLLKALVKNGDIVEIESKKVHISEDFQVSLSREFNK